MQDSLLLVSGSISGVNNQITGQSLVGVTTSAATLSSFSVDSNPLTALAGGSGIDWGEGAQLFLRVVVQTAITATGLTGLTVNIVNAGSADLVTTTPQVLASLTIAATSTNTIAAGTVAYLVLPPQIGSVGQEFYGASFQAVGANVAAGAVIAYFTNVVDDPKGKFYKSGFSVK